MPSLGTIARELKPIMKRESAAAKLIKDKSLLYNTEQQLVGQKETKPRPIKLAAYTESFFSELRNIATYEQEYLAKAAAVKPPNTKLERRRKVELAAALGVPVVSLPALGGVSKWQFGKNLVPREEAYKLYEGIAKEPLAKRHGTLGQFLSFRADPEKGRIPVMAADNPLAYGIASIEGEKTLITPAGEKINPYVISHEAGHAKGRTAQAIKRLGHLHRIGHAAPLAALGVLPFAGSEKAETAGYIAGGVGGAATLPMLTEEARASARAFKALKGVKGLSRAKFLKTLLPAFGTYGSIGALATLGPMALGRYFSAHAKKRRA